ncbi:MAG: hypothetical protein LBL96_05455 [Clostridiales bacterium]|jgi:hypothetical protein|nr:hypothetical protein [Clostridiales bacterium]
MQKTQLFIIISLLAVLVWQVATLNAPESVYETEYAARKFDAATIYYTAQDEKYVSLIARMTDLYLPLLMTDFGRSDTGCHVTVVIRPDKSGSRNRAVRYEEALPMGSYAGGVVYILSPTLWLNKDFDAGAMEYFMQNGPLIHELAHHASANMPSGERWLREGVALYYEYKYTGREWRADLEELAKRLTLDDLRDRFEELDYRIAYRKAFEIVKNYANTHGEAMLQAVLYQTIN